MEETGGHHGFLRKIHDHAAERLLLSLKNTTTTTNNPGGQENNNNYYNNSDIFSDRFMIFFFFLWNVAVGAHLVPVILLQMRGRIRCDCALVARILCFSPAILVGMALPVYFAYDASGVGAAMFIGGITIVLPYFGWFWCISHHTHPTENNEYDPYLTCCFCCCPQLLLQERLIHQRRLHQQEVGNNIIQHNNNNLGSDDLAREWAPEAGRSPLDIVAALASAVENHDDHENPFLNSTLYRKEREILILNTIIVKKVIAAGDEDEDENLETNENLETKDDADSLGHNNTTLRSEVEARRPTAAAQREGMANDDMTKPSNGSDSLKQGDGDDERADKEDNSNPTDPSPLTTTSTEETPSATTEEGVVVTIPPPPPTKSDIILSLSDIRRGEDDEEGIEVGDDDNEEEEGVNSTRRQCYICLDNYQPGDEIAWSRNPNCPHVFHKDCLVGWLMSHAECPVCRNPYDHEEELRA